MVDEMGAAPVVEETEQRKEKKKKSKSEKKSRKSSRTSSSSRKSSGNLSSPEVADESEEMSPQAVTQLPTKMMGHMNGDGSDVEGGIEGAPRVVAGASRFVLPEVEEDSSDDATYTSSVSRMSAAFVQFAPSIPFVDDGGVESAGFQRIQAENKPALVECVAADNVYADPDPPRSPKSQSDQGVSPDGRGRRGSRKSRGGGIIGGLAALSQGTSGQEKDDLTIMTAPTPGSAGGRRHRSRSLTGRDLRKATRDAASTDSQSVSSGKAYSSQSVNLTIGRSSSAESSSMTSPVPTNISTRPVRSQSLFQPRTSSSHTNSGLSHEQMLSDPRLQQMLADPRLQQMLADQQSEQEQEPQMPIPPPPPPPQASFPMPMAPASRSQSIASNTSDYASDYGDQHSLQSRGSGDGTGSVGGRRKFKLNVSGNHVQSDYSEDDANSTASDRLSDSASSSQQKAPEKAPANGKQGKSKEKKSKRRFKISKLLNNHVQADYDLEEELGITVSDPINSLHSILEQEDEIAEAVLAARQVPVGRPIQSAEVELAALNAFEDRSEGRRLASRLGLERKGSEKQGGDWGMGAENGSLPKEKRGIGRMFRKKNKNGEGSVESSEHSSEMSLSSAQKRGSNSEPAPSHDSAIWEHPSGMMALNPSLGQSLDTRTRMMEDNPRDSFRRRRRGRSTGPAE